MFRMLTKLPLILFLLHLVQTIKPEPIPIQEPTPNANCYLDTFCKTPSMATDYKYDGIVRSGYSKIDGKAGSALGFIFFGKKGVTDQTQLKNQPTIIVLGGGPGLSSQFSSLREMGPLTLKRVFSIGISDNSFTWAKDANLLFVDQPLGTGVSCLSTTSHLASTMAQVTQDFFKAFNQLFREDGNGCFNSKNLGIPSSSPFFILGQGYGAKFATAIATYLKKNGINSIKGIGLGNPLISPFKIISELGLYGSSLGLLDYQERTRMQKILLKASIYEQQKSWASLTTEFQRAVSYLNQRTGLSYYDITKDGFDEGTFAINLDVLKIFFSNVSNLNNFGFENSTTFVTRSDIVFNKLSSDFMVPETQNLQWLLGQQVPVLIYQGQDDAYVNTAGTIKWVDEINYSQSQDFRNKNLQVWKINGVVKGSRKSAGKLTFVVVNNAGHYAPQDNPESTYYMFKDFLKASS